jgi:hypothetical protein
VASGCGEEGAEDSSREGCLRSRPSSLDCVWRKWHRTEVREELDKVGGVLPAGALTSFDKRRSASLAGGVGKEEKQGKSEASRGNRERSDPA